MEVLDSGQFIFLGGNGLQKVAMGEGRQWGNKHQEAKPLEGETTESSEVAQ